MTKFRTEIIGDCTLVLGDALDVMPTLGKVDAVITDPPYGTTQCKWDSVIPLATIWDNIRSVINPNVAVVLFGMQPFTTLLIASNIEMFKYNWIWQKSQAKGFLNAWNQPMRDSEDITVFYDGQCTYNPELKDKPKENIRPITPRTKQSDCYGEYSLEGRKCPADKDMPRTIINYNNAQQTEHPTQKPVDLMKYLVKTYTNAGDTVLDFTMGSGTTLVACAKLGRKGIGIELEEKYFDIACKRVEEAYRQPDMFIEPPKKIIQGDLLNTE